MTYESHDSEFPKKSSALEISTQVEGINALESTLNESSQQHKNQNNDYLQKLEILKNRIFDQFKIFNKEIAHSFYSKLCKLFNRRYISLRAANIKLANNNISPDDLVSVIYDIIELGQIKDEILIFEILIEHPKITDTILMKALSAMLYSRNNIATVSQKIYVALLYASWPSQSAEQTLNKFIACLKEELVTLHIELYKEMGPFKIILLR